MAEIVRRRSWGGVLPLGRHVSISGSSLIQCASVSMAPPHPGGAKCYPGAKVQGRTGPRSTDTSHAPRMSMDTPHVLGAPDVPIRTFGAARTAHTPGPNLSAERIGVQPPRV